MAKFLNRNLRIETGKKVIMGDSAESFLKYDGSDLLINVDSNNLLNIGNPATASDYNMVLTNAGNSGGALKIVLDGHAVDEDYNAIELSNVSTTPYDSYQYMNSMWIKTHIAGAALVGNAIDIYGADFVTWTNGTGFYNSIYGGSHIADVRTDATVDYITGHSSLARQQAACTKASSSLIANENLATVQGSGLIAEVKATHNYTSLDASAQATDVYGSWTQVGVDLGATVADIYLDRMQFTGTGGATGDIWGLYIEGAEKNYMQGELNVLPGGSTSAMEITAATQTIGIVADTSIILNQAADSIVLEGANATIATFDPNGLTLASGASVNEFSTDGTLLDDSDDAVPTEKAVKTYVDNAIGGAVDHNSTTGLQGGDSTTSEFYHLTQDIHDGLYSGSPIIGMGAVAGTNMEVDYGAHVVSVDVNGSEVLNLTAATQTIGIAADTSIILNQAADSIVLEGANATIATFDPDGLTLASGASVNEFSTDGTLGGDTDDAVPTEKAVKLYVDTEIANIATDQIISSDSYVKVVDDGTAAGYIEVVADGVQVQYWDAQAATIRMGKESAAGRIVINDTTLQGYVASTQVFSAAESVQIFGVNGDTYLSLSQSGDAANLVAGNVTALALTDVSQRLGPGTSSNVLVNNTTNTITIDADTTEVVSLTNNVQTLGVSGDTNIALNQTDNTIDGVVASANVLHLDDDGDHRVGADGNNAKLVLDETNHKATLYANSSYYLEIDNQSGGGGTLRYFDNSTEIISANTTEIYVGDDAFVSDGTRFYASLDSNYATIDANGFELKITSAGLNLHEDGQPDASVSINQVLNTVDGDAIDAASTDSQLATAKLIYNTIGNITPNEITQGDSYVRVVDDGTAAGYVEVVADGVQVQYWDAQAATIRMGKESAAGRVVVNDTEVILSVGSLEYVKVDASSQVFGTLQGGGRFTTNSSNAFIHAGSLLDTELIFTATDTSQTLGVSGNTTFNLNQSTGTAIISTPGGTMLSVDGNVQRLGGSTDTFLSLTQNTNTVDLRAGNVSVLNATDTAQTFGVSGDASLVLNQTADTFVLAAGANTQISGGLTSLALGVAGDTTITLDQSADTVTITAGGESQVLVETSGTTITDDLTVSGDLFVDGTTWVVHNQEVTTSDNLIVINYGETGSGVTAGSAGFEIDRGQLTNYQFLFVEASDTFRIGEVGSLQAVATREDAPTDTRVPWWNDSAKRYDTAGSSSITINTSTDVIAFNAADGEVATLEADGLTLASGTNINEFSTDGTLAGDSDDAVPTEQAVKTYVDAQIGGSSNIIFEDDSYVKVTDDGTDVGWIEIVADGVQVAYFDPSAATQRIGKASSAGKVEVTDTAVELYYAGAKAMYTHVDGITVRDTNSTGPKLIFEDQNDTTMGQIDCLANIIEMKVGSSLETVFKATINAAAELYYDNVKVFETTSDGIKLNLGAATINEFSTDGTLAGDSDTAVPTEKAVKLYVDTKVGTEVYSGIADIVNGDTTATVIFDVAQADADYTITTHIVNTTDLSPSLYVHMTTEYDENGFTEVFSGPMDSGNYKLHFVITRADQGV